MPCCPFYAAIVPSKAEQLICSSTVYLNKIALIVWHVYTMLRRQQGFPFVYLSITAQFALKIILV